MHESLPSSAHPAVVTALWLLPAVATLMALASHAISVRDGDGISTRAWIMSTIGGMISLMIAVLVWTVADFSPAVLGYLVWDLTKLVGHQTCFGIRFFVNQPRIDAQRANPPSRN